MAAPAGALRFNSDSGKLEYYNGEAWWQIDNFSADNATGGARGVFGGGDIGPALTNVIEYITINSTGNAIDFGDLLSAREYVGGLSSATRGVFAGSWSPGKTNVIDYVQIMTTGNAQTFGELVNIGVMQEMGTSNGHGGLG